MAPLLREEREEEVEKRCSFCSCLISAFRCDNLRSKLRAEKSPMYELIIIFSGKKYQDKEREGDGRTLGEEKENI